MERERWQQLERVCQAALDRAGSERAAFLEAACAGDEALRREVETLLAHEKQAENYLEAPPLEDTLGAEPDRLVVAQAGKVFGPYLLIRLLGKGGFGQVWEAESLDNRRRVALKVLTEVGAGDPDALRRFEREGQLAASLSHPNCVYLFGAQQIKGYPTIAMELMPGGTLQDQLNRQGKLPVRQAVDLTLQIIDGLEAAHQAGIVHRDVKPSNCFLDAEGHAKIGDFGISKTLECGGDLTLTGCFVGTPSYASPEQVRGREVGFRSDIYSVGALLYALLTGKPPFVGNQAGEVLARIVAEEPTSFSEHQVEVPRALQRIVLRRALAKDKERRYQDYGSFRDALIPFSSHGLTSATLARRLGAITFDWAAFLPVMLPVQLWGLRRGLQPGPLAAIYALSAMLWFLYFVVTEKLWAQSLGKFLFRLRVTTPDGSAITLGQACLRTAVFVYSLAAPKILVSLFPLPHQSSQPIAWAYALLPPLSFYAVLASTMRRSNGYAGLHEILSNTRTRAVRKVELTVLAESKTTDIAPRLQPSRLCGPYRLTQTVWETETEALFGGYDDILRRRIWVHTFRDAARAPAVPRLAVARPGQLQWLQGSRAADNAWDAYEALPGIRFSSWVRAKGRLSWHEVRGVLSGVLIGISARLREPDSSGGLSLSHIWFGARGQARILDFPAALEESQSDDLAAVASWSGLIHQMVLFGLEGNLLKLKDVDSRVPHIPLPEYVRPLMRSICQVGPASPSPEELLAELNAVADRPAKITAKRRIGPVLAIAAVPVLVFLLLFLFVPRVLSMIPDAMLDFALAQKYAGFLGDLRKQRIEKTPEGRLRPFASCLPLATARRNLRHRVGC